MAEGPRRRLRLMSTLLVGIVFVVVAQLAQVQLVAHQFYEDWGKEQRERPIAIADPPRGVIRDRHSHLLVGNVVKYSIEADTAYVVEAERAASVLAPLLHVPASRIEQLLRSEDPWVQLSSSVSKELGEQIASLGLRGITVRPLWARAYTEGRLASHVLGFCNAQGVGFYGVEGFHDQVLQPNRLEWEGPLDPASEQIPWAVAPVELPESGAELVLTLDRTIQALVEEELARSVYQSQAEGGTIIVMDPRTFEILALANLPDYDPDRYHEFYVSDSPPFEDPAVSHQYEPGSVLKVLTVAAALSVHLATFELENGNFLPFPLFLNRPDDLGPIHKRSA
jgi:cell division protein FtsI/penicillin-binding protein 2